MHYTVRWTRRFLNESQHGKRSVKAENSNFYYNIQLRVAYISIQEINKQRDTNSMHTGDP